MLTRQCEFYRNQTEHLEKKILMLEKEVKRERGRYDRFLTTHYDQISAAFKLRPPFAKALEDTVKPKGLEAPELTPDEEQRLVDIAKDLHAQDIANGENRGLHEYLNAVRQQPDHYLNQ